MRKVCNKSCILLDINVILILERQWLGERNIKRMLFILDRLENGPVAYDGEILRVSHGRYPKSI